MRRSMLAWAVVLALAAQLVALPGWPGTARAAELMLMDERRTDGSGYAWLFLGLSAISFAVASNDYQETQDNMKKAKAAYDNYRAAKTASDATYYRDQTTGYSNKAQAYESTTNGALVIGTLFFIGAVAVFRAKPYDSTPILLSQNGIELQFKF